MATGHIRKRTAKNGDVSYQIIVESDKDPLTGKRDRKYITLKGVTRKTAEATLRKTIADLESGKVITESSVKVSDWMTEWLSAYLPNIEATTRAGYKEKINEYIIPHLGEIPIKSLKTYTIQSWVNYLKDTKRLSPKTIKNAFLNLKAALDKAVVLQMINRNPCTGVELPKLIKPKGDIYDEDEINTMLKAAEGTDMYLLLLLASYIGFRRGEILALTWDDIDFNNKIIHISKNTVKAEGKTITKAPKSASGIRDITISDKIVSELKKARVDYLKNKLSCGSEFEDSNLVICQPDGKGIQPDSLTKKWERFVARNNLKKIRFQDLRHSCATMMAKAGVSPKVMQQRLGHADISVTMNIYTHVTHEMDREAANRLDDLMFNRKAN